MNLRQYKKKYGRLAFYKLATACDITPRYLIISSYSRYNKGFKLITLEKLIIASNWELTKEELMPSIYGKGGELAKFKAKIERMEKKREKMENK